MIPFDPAIHRIVPPRGHVIVEADPPEDQHAVIWEQKSPGYYTGLVVDKASDVTAVNIGDRVLVQMMSGHPGMSRVLTDAYERRVAVVPAARLPSPVRSEEYARRQKHLRWLQRGKPGVTGQAATLTEADRLQMWFHECHIAEIKRQRRACGRDRLLPPVEDVAQAEGILAVIED